MNQFEMFLGRFLVIKIEIESIKILKSKNDRLIFIIISLFTGATHKDKKPDFH